jgi:DNA-binding SARP family transcriptional activator
LGILENQQEEFREAQLKLDNAIEMLEDSDNPLQLTRALLHRANTAYLSGEKDRSIEFIEHALRIVGKMSFDHFLVLEGLTIEPVLNHAINQGIRVGQIEDLISRIHNLRASLTSTSETEIQVEAQPVLKISAFGLPNIIIDGTTVQWPVAKSRDLLFYLLQHPNGRSKEQIGLTFWPDHGPERLDSAFRSTLYRLRRVVYRECVVFEENLYKFNWNSDYAYDINEFDYVIDKAATTPSPEEASRLLESGLAVYKGDYLLGLDYAWVTIERERLRGKYIRAIDNLAGLYADQRKLHRSVQLYKELLEQDPFQEKAHRELMRCYYRMGDRAAAIRQYHHCVEMLRNELDLTPSQEMEDLYLQIIR